MAFLKRQVGPVMVIMPPNQAKHLYIQCGKPSPDVLTARNALRRPYQSAYLSRCPPAPFLCGKRRKIRNVTIDKQIGFNGLAFPRKLR
jgi:hypothetical protein